MLQMHPVETPIDQNAHPRTVPRSRDENHAAWLLMSEVQQLLQGDVEELETVRRLRAALTELLPALCAIRDNQFLSGCLSDLLHASTEWADKSGDLVSDLGSLVDTLDELAIRLEWNLPVTEIVPFADIRLARWIAEVNAYNHRRTAAKG